MVVPIAAVAAARQRGLAAARNAREKAKQNLKKTPQGSADDASAEKNRPSLAEIALFAGPIAALNDALDIFEITIIGKLVIILIDFVTAAILFLWFWIRVGSNPQRKTVTMLITFFAELGLGVGIFPMWLILVINARTGWFNLIFKMPEKLLSL
ncbi:MAG: hypothetical protein A2827_02600 [Candidatus Spechtbacteria bacterium RIFCSPHIGHO2_01_FULL_43_30]|uniref:Uncharacterized protein n=1 Tax=Candidatus Spechtbacteria bacterium RIFCSPHIGHO2_01_FULL_43_30 TaxID=1802158 RepID=A0A1G2H757_9BACT|nr:MAG: hypothetical protein A2827_02600 [Candidatus Spechtbacteria bacterium RIFCSPHIGHO2_01_FULL_43_30]